MMAIRARRPTGHKAQNVRRCTQMHACGRWARHPIMPVFMCRAHYAHMHRAFQATGMGAQSMGPWLTRSGQALVCREIRKARHCRTAESTLR